MFGLALAAAALSHAQESLALPKDLEARCDKIFAAWDRKDGPGGVVAVMQGDDVVFKKAYGLANLENSVPNTTDTLFDIGSISKQFTAMCLLLLQEDGLLSIDDPVSKYLPGFDGLAEHKVTIRDLLTHSSGLRDMFVLMLLSGERQYTDAEVLDVLKRQRTFNFDRDTQFMYSNSGYFLAAQIVEAVSKKPLSVFAKERIFDPLGMDSTQIKDRAGMVIPDVADSYVKSGKTWIRDDKNVTAVGASGVQTCIADMAKWVANFRHNKLGKGDQHLIEEMQQPHILSDGKDSHYGLGLIITDLGGVRQVQHSGGWEAYRSMVSRFPDYDLAIITFGNGGSLLPLNGNNALAKELLADKMEPAKPERPAVALPEADLQGLVGTYQLNSDKVAVVTRLKQRLFIQVTGQARFEVFAAKKDDFFYRNIPAEVVFERDTDDKVTSATITQNDVAYKMPRIDPYVPTDDYLDSLSGTYHSDELNATIELVKSGKSLVAKVKGYRSLALAFHLKDHARSGAWSFDFDRDEKGSVTAFRIGTNRAINMVYKRIEQHGSDSEEWWVGLGARAFSPHRGSRAFRLARALLSTQEWRVGLLDDLISNSR
ncbi:MAG TPA: serine hydrolase [Fimbriimonadaceae bacterium]|nr:serine hydrolase [Fimbriimonadaceae bacterium]